MPKEFRRQLSHRIQEFELWKDDKDVLKDFEYAKRRADRRRQLKKLESDKRLKRWKKLYIPSIVGILAGSIILLCSSVSSLGKNTFFWSNKQIYYVLGPVLLLLGVLGLMVAAALSYKEEERLRQELGLPSMFPLDSRSPSIGKVSVNSCSERKISKAMNTSKLQKYHRYRRQQSIDSVENTTFLETSVSSAATDLTWLGSSSFSGRPSVQVLRDDETDETLALMEEHNADFRVILTDNTAGSSDCVCSEKSSCYSTVTRSSELEKNYLSTTSNDDSCHKLKGLNDGLLLSVCNSSVTINIDT